MSPGPLNIEHTPGLTNYLRATGRIGHDETVQTSTLAGGVSNRTVLVERSSGEAWVLKQALAKLRVAVDWFSDPARIEREALGLHWLARLAPPGTITPLVFEDPAHHLLAMMAVPQPHENWKAMLLDGRVEQDHVDQFGGLLGAIHRRAAESPEPLRKVFDNRTYFESLRLEPYYGYAAEGVGEARTFLHDLIDKTRSRRLTLVHGDYSPKNILVHAGRLILLDHEVIHWGDPAFDVGFAMAHLLSKANHLPHARDKFASAAERFAGTYSTSVGQRLWTADQEAMAVRHTIGCLLARVAGRSPLEYLTPGERDRQRLAALALMSRPPATLNELIQQFLDHISHA